MSNGNPIMAAAEPNIQMQPTITMWNRVEGRPRKADFNRALRAEIRDPLWMLTKQWQLGEFEGDDAGSPVLARAMMNKKRLTKYKSANGKAQAYNNNIPLEALVEQLPLPFNYSNDKKALLDVRIMIGRYWLKLIGATHDEAIQYAKKFSIEVPNEDKVLAHSESYQKFAGSKWRMDGFEFYDKLNNDEIDIESLPGEVDEDKKEKFIKWVKSFFLQPSENNLIAYIPSRLEYQFKCAAPDKERETVYEAEEYYAGKLDWYSLSINDEEKTLNVDFGSEVDSDSVDGKIKNDELFNKNRFCFIPVNIDYEGMPDTRWWKFEDRNTYLGDIAPDTTDISKLLFLEFSLLYANDWFLIPQQLPAASISNIKGLVVTNCFNENTLISPTGEGPDDSWTRWTMFTVNRKGKDQKEADHSLFLLPAISKVQESEPMERVVFVRDEIANMVWGIETDISLSSGDRLKGAEAARELKAYYEKSIQKDDELKNNDLSTIRYKIMSTVPENWIPFIPVHVGGDKREIKLQRASMPRESYDEQGKKVYVAVKPRTSILRYGLDDNVSQPYYIFEEEIPRAGIIVNNNFQRTRWYGGRVYNWLGIHKTTGRGEGSSGLKFDYLTERRI